MHLNNLFDIHTPLEIFYFESREHFITFLLRIYKFHHTDIDLCLLKIISIWASKEFEENISRYLICEHF